MSPGTTQRARCFICFRPVPPHRVSFDESREPSTCSSACEVRSFRNRGAVQVIRNRREFEPVEPYDNTCDWCKTPIHQSRKFCSSRCKNALYHARQRGITSPPLHGTYDPEVVAMVIARGPGPRDCKHDRWGFFLDVCKDCLLGRLEIETIAMAQGDLRD